MADDDTIEEYITQSNTVVMCSISWLHVKTLSEAMYFILH
jgi:hypothetical protein